MALEGLMPAETEVSKAALEGVKELAPDSR